MSCCAVVLLFFRCVISIFRLFVVTDEADHNHRKIDAGSDGNVSYVYTEAGLYISLYQYFKHHQSTDVSGKKLTEKLCQIVFEMLERVFDTHLST